MSREGRKSLACRGIFEATTDTHDELRAAVVLAKTPATHLIPIANRHLCGVPIDWSSIPGINSWLTS